MDYQVWVAAAGQARATAPQRGRHARNRRPHRHGGSGRQPKEPPMIELSGLTKVFGGTRAVDDLTCSVEPGMVTGFLGPNGAGKPTTMRVILGLDHPPAGTATIDGRAYRELKDPLRTVGALLDARQAHPNRSARNHLRTLMRALAGEGRTVFVSSHLLAEMANTADRLIVIGKGKLIASTTVAEFVGRSGADTVRVRSPQLDTLRRVLTEAGLTADTDHGSALLVRGAAIEVIGDLAARNAITLHELSAQQASLEEAYMRLTDDATEYRAVSR